MDSKLRRGVAVVEGELCHRLQHAAFFHQPASQSLPLVTQRRQRCCACAHALMARLAAHDGGIRTLLLRLHPEHRVQRQLHHVSRGVLGGALHTRHARPRYDLRRRNRVDVLLQCGVRARFATQHICQRFRDRRHPQQHVSVQVQSLLRLCGAPHSHDLAEDACACHGCPGVNVQAHDVPHDGFPHDREVLGRGAGTATDACYAHRKRRHRARACIQQPQPEQQRLAAVVVCRPPSTRELWLSSTTGWRTRLTWCKRQEQSGQPEVA